MEVYRHIYSTAHHGRRPAPSQGADARSPAWPVHRSVHAVTHAASVAGAEEGRGIVGGGPRRENMIIMGDCYSCKLRWGHNMRGETITMGSVKVLEKC